MPDFWQRMGEVDPTLTEKATTLRDYVFADGRLPRRTKELIYLGMCCAIRFSDGIRIHARRALEHGSSREEIHEAVALSLIGVGVPAYREAIILLRDLLWPATERPKMS